MSLVKSMMKLFIRRPQESQVPHVIPKGLTSAYLRAAVMSKLSDHLSIAVIGGKPIVMADCVPVPLRAFLLTLGRQMNRNTTSAEIRAIERELTALWLESGVPSEAHDVACQNPWWLVEGIVAEIIREWRSTPDPVQTFADSLRHLDDLYMVAVASADEEAQMAEAALSSGSG